MDGAEAVSAPWVSTSSRICVSFSLPSNLCLQCERIILSSLSSLHEVKIRQIKQAWYNLALRRSFPQREVKSPQLSKVYWRLPNCFMYPSGRHWDALRMDEWWMLTKMWRWKLPVIEWNPAFAVCNGKTSRFNRCPEVTTLYCMNLLFPKALCRKLLLFCVVYSNHTEEANKSSKFLAKHK